MEISLASAKRAIFANRFWRLAVSLHPCSDTPAPGRGAVSLAPQLRYAMALTALQISLLFTTPLLWPVPRHPSLETDSLVE